MEGLCRFFLYILNQSIIISYVIIVILMIRFFLKKAPKIFSYLLWGAVLIRFICPVSIESGFSLVPLNLLKMAERFNEHVIQMGENTNDFFNQEDYKIDLEMTKKNSEKIQLDFEQQKSEKSQNQESLFPLKGERKSWEIIGACLWLSGFIVLSGYQGFLFYGLRKKLSKAVWIKENIYLIKEMTVPFIMGIQKPKIYLPTVLEKEEEIYILLHEKTHIKRKDYLIKMLFFVFVCIYWFHPLVWLAFYCMERDMEMSCDESVIQKMDREILKNEKRDKDRMKKINLDHRKAYASSLLKYAAGGKRQKRLSISFAESDTKSRIKNILSYKSPSKNVFYIGIGLILILCLGLSMNRKNGENDLVQSVPELYSGNHYCVEFVLEDGKAGQLLLSQPKEKGENGTWCVERWKDWNGKVHTVYSKQEGSEQELIELAYSYLTKEKSLTIDKKDLILKDFGWEQGQFLIEPEYIMPAYLYKLDVENQIIKLDEVEWLETEDEERLRELGLDPDEGSQDMITGYYIYNEKKEFMELKVTDKTDYEVVNWGNEAGKYRYKSVSAEAFQKYVSTEPEMDRVAPCWVVIKNGVVVRVVEQLLV